MGLRDRFRRRSQPKPSEAAQRRLEGAIAHAVTSPSSHATSELHDALIDSVLLLAVEKQPATIATKTVASPMTSLKNGEHTLLAFSSFEQLIAHTSEAVLMTLPAGAIFRLMLDGGYSALCLNPAGTPVELSREDVQALRARIKPQ